MQFCLINICPKLHHRHWQKLRVTLPCNMSTVTNFLDFTTIAVLRPTFIQKLCYKLPNIVAFTFIQIFLIRIVPSLLNGIRVAAFTWYSVKIRERVGVILCLWISLSARFALSFYFSLLFLHVSPFSCYRRKMRAFLLFVAHLESSKSVQKRRSYNCLKVRHIFVSLSNNGCDVTMKSASELRTLIA